MTQETIDRVTDLTRRAADGDQVAWDALVTQYTSLLRSVVRKFRLGDQRSADIVQTTWLRLVLNIRQIRDPERLAGWLTVTARNLSLDAVRQAQRLRPLEDGHEGPSTDETPEAAALHVARDALIRRAFHRLRPRDQELLTLLVASPPVPYEEISAMLGMPIGSIGPTRQRALRRLRVELAADGLVDASGW